MENDINKFSYYYDFLQQAVFVYNTEALLLYRNKFATDLFFMKENFYFPLFEKQISQYIQTEINSNIDFLFEQNNELQFFKVKINHSPDKNFYILVIQNFEANYLYNSLINRNLVTHKTGIWFFSSIENWFYIHSNFSENEIPLKSDKYTLTDFLTFFKKENTTTFLELLSVNTFQQNEKAEILLETISNKHIKFYFEKRQKIAAETIFWGTFQDVTELFFEQQKITEKENLFKLLLKNTSDLIALHDISGKFLYLSPSLTDLLGYEESELLNETPINLFHKNDKQKIKLEAFKTLLEGKTPEIVQYRIRKKNGQYIWVETKASPVLNSQNEIIQIVTSTRDIQIRKNNERVIQKAHEKAISATKAKVQFLSAMSHEVRTPLNAIINMAYMLKDTEFNDTQLKYINTILSSSENLLMLINDILDFSKIDTGRVNLTETEFSFSNIVSNIVEAQQYICDNKGIVITLHISENFPAKLIGDPVRISQIVNNLVNNAVKFTRKGTIDVTLSVLEDDTKSADIFFSVKDSGIGISSQNLQKIFKPFSQESSATTRKYGGTGIGLTLSRKLLILMKSNIQVESELNKGSTFKFLLKLQKIVEKQDLKKVEKNNQQIFNLHNIKVLVVEDNEINRFVAAQFLKKWNTETDFAENGKIAVDKVNNKEYDIILMDLEMPELDGFEASKQIRCLQNERYANLPIIAVSAFSYEEIKFKLKLCGINEYIAKPYTPEELYSKIASFTIKNEHKTSKEILIDYSKIEEMVEGNMDLLKNINNVTIRSLKNFQIEFSNALVNNNNEQMKKARHSIKPIIETLSISKLHLLLEKIKIAYDTKLLAEVEKQNVITELKNLCENINLQLVEKETELLMLL